ncbi:hypothetical protein CQW23_28192 [Capsicum baccatum]|uniref:Ubiquitin-like protease family profile domain-containing protein n=1 Tax=Capsicum baccatum TaxID=33114 RepID=A0A2G2VFT5_CAPBA|nr:hypothetical protein CQW23_28192 [Capsicum baccatum]
MSLNMYLLEQCANKEPEEANIDDGGLDTFGKHYSPDVFQNSDKMFDGTNVKEQCADKEPELPNIDDGGLETSGQHFSPDVVQTLDKIFDSTKKIDVCFYYLRKKSKYEPHNSYKYSIVDCNFMNTIRSVIEVYFVDDPNLIEGGQEYHINKYINGFYIHVVVPRHTVNNIVIPINIKDRHHCVLIVLSFSERCIFLHDSYESSGYYVVVLSKIKKLAEIIPLCLHACNFYEKKGIDLHNHPRDKDKDSTDLFDVLFEEGLPQQPSGSLDCGLYMVRYAECLSYG